VFKRNPGPATSLEGVRLPVEDDQITAAREMLQDNKGAEWSVCFSIGIQVGGNVELRDNLVALLVEFDVPMATISDAFGLSGREVWAIAESEPISVFRCLGCKELLKVRDRRDLLRLRRALRATSGTRPGELGSSSLLCDSCTHLSLQLRSEGQRLNRLAQQSRAAQLRKMPFAEYRRQPEWQARRTATLSRAGYRCQVCGERDARLDVHHNTYDRYGDESACDLVALCGGCHERFHGIVEDAS
jgi:5-methylcytosine-specific restriction endonuclease McrA